MSVEKSTLRTKIWKILEYFSPNLTKSTSEKENEPEYEPEYAYEYADKYTDQYESDNLYNNNYSVGIAHYIATRKYNTY
jgi:hypothetical protein